MGINLLFQKMNGLKSNLDEITGNKTEAQGQISENKNAQGTNRAGHTTAVQGKNQAEATIQEVTSKIYSFDIAADSPEVVVNEDGTETTTPNQEEIDRIQNELQQAKAEKAAAEQQLQQFNQQIQEFDANYQMQMTEFGVLDNALEGFNQEEVSITGEISNIDQEIQGLQVELDQKAKQEEVNAEDIKGGVNKEDFVGNEAVFDKLDADGNGVLDAGEVQGLKDASGKNGELSNREAKKFGKEIGLDKKDRSSVKSVGFGIAKAGNDIQESTVTVENGIKTINTKKKDGSSVKTNYTMNQNGQAKLKSETKADKDGNSVETNYNEKGKKTNTVNTDKKTNAKLTTDFDEEGNATSATEVDGSTEKTYGKGGKVEGRELTVTENKGTEAEVLTTNEYNEQGVKTKSTKVSGDVVVETEFKGEETVETIKKGDKVTLKTTTNKDGKIEEDFQKDKTVTTKYDAKGVKTNDLVQQLDENGKVIRSANSTYGAEGNKLEEVVTDKNGNAYKVTYDGKGNTNVITQNNESWSSLHAKFGKEGQSLADFEKEMKKLNGSSFKNGLQVGQGLKVPGEIAADDSSIKNRKTAKDAIQQYTKATEGKLKTEMYQEWFSNGFTDSDGNFTLLSTDDQCKGLTTNNYKSGEGIAKQVLKEQGIENPTADEINNTRRKLEILNFGSSNNKSLLNIKEVKVPKSKTEMKNFVATEKQTRNAEISEQKSAMIQGNSINIMQTNLNAAAVMFDEQMKKDGWAADAADGISKIWNNDLGESIGISTGNTASQVREDIAAQQELIDELKQAPDHQTFVKIFESKTGIKYDEQSHQNLQNYMTEVQSNKKPYDRNTYNQLYTKAYGNNMMERVQGYNDSQDTGAGIVKMGTAIVVATAITVATWGTGAPAAGAVLVAAGTNVAVDVSDKMSNNVANDINPDDLVMDVATAFIPGGKGSAKLTSVFATQLFNGLAESTISGGTGYIVTELISNLKTSGDAQSQELLTYLENNPDQSNDIIKQILASQK